MEIDKPILQALTRYGTQLVTTKNEREKRAGTAIVTIAEQFPKLKQENEMLKHSFDSLIMHLMVKEKVPLNVIESARSYISLKLMEIDLQTKKYQ